jgi:hypothetical protein
MSNLPTTDSEAMATFQKLVEETDAPEKQRIAVAMMMGVRYGEARGRGVGIKLAFSTALQKVRADLEKVDS